MTTQTNETTTAASKTTANQANTNGMAALLRREIVRLESTIREGTSSSLQTTSDELKLQAHLGVLEARDRMALMETFTQKLATRINDAAHVAAETGALQLALGSMELKDAVEERTQRARAEFRQSTQDARDAIQTAWRDLELRVGALAREVGKLF